MKDYLGPILYIALGVSAAMFGGGCPGGPEKDKDVAEAEGIVKELNEGNKEAYKLAGDLDKKIDEAGKEQEKK